MFTSYQNAGQTHIQEPVSTLKMCRDSISCEHHYQIKDMLKKEMYAIPQFIIFVFLYAIKQRKIKTNSGNFTHYFIWLLKFLILSEAPR